MTFFITGYIPVRLIFTDFISDMIKFKFLVLVTLFTFINLTADPVRDMGGSDAYPGGFYDGDPIPDQIAYFTFDDGPAEWTGDILDILKEENIKATFFICAFWNNKKMSGKSAFQRYKGSLQRTVREGHILANHTVGHKVLSKLSGQEIEWQFKHNQKLLNKTLGSEAPLMTILRLPLGRPWSNRTSLTTKKHVGSIVRKTGIVAMWSKEFDSTDSWDWAKGEWYRESGRIDESHPLFIEKKRRIFDRIVSRADGRGMIILMHDTHSTTKSVLGSIIKELKKRGYRFGTMEDYVVWRYGKSSRELLAL